MGLFSREKRSIPPRPLNLVSSFGGWSFITENNPISLRCEQLIGETIGGLPLLLYENVGTSRKRAGWTAEYKVVKNEPNIYETPAVFYSTLVKQLLRKGNVYVLKMYDGKDLAALYLLDADKMEIQLNGSMRTYRYNGEIIDRKTFIHIPSPYGYDGKIGKGIMQFARDPINLSNMLSEYLGYYLENSLNSKLKLELPIPFDKLDAEALAKVKTIQDFIQKSIGKDRTGKALTIFEGMKADKLDLATNRDSELSISREQQDRIIAMIYGVPYNLLVSDNKYNSDEEFNLSFLAYTLSPYTRRIQEAFTHSIVPLSQKERFYFEYSFESLLKTSTQKRYEIYAKGLNNGVLSINEILKKENQDTIGSAGDYHFIPANLLPATQDVIDSMMANSKLKQQQVDDQKGQQPIDNKMK